jgi:hypothetical protein
MPKEVKTAKPVEKVKGGLKLRAARAKKATLSFKIGVKKYELPMDKFEVRYLNSDKYVFVHVPPAAELLEVANGKLAVMSENADATEALASFRSARRRKRSRSGPTDEEQKKLLAEIAKKIPAGYKLTYDASGKPRLAKTRNRNK